MKCLRECWTFDMRGCWKNALSRLTTLKSFVVKHWLIDLEYRNLSNSDTPFRIEIIVGISSWKHWNNIFIGFTENWKMSALSNEWRKKKHLYLLWFFLTIFLIDAFKICHRQIITIPDLIISLHFTLHEYQEIVRMIG